MNVEFTVEARQDILDSYLWYEKQRLGLGDEFILCIDEARERISRYPESSPKVYIYYRKCFVRRFPYVLYYRIVEDRIIVIGVLHVKRNPQAIRDSLMNRNSESE